MNIELNNNRVKAHCLLLLLIGFTAFQLKAQTTYYSSNSATQPLDWDDPSSWTLNSDGSGGGAGVPGRTDNVFILTGHEVIVDQVNDNGSPGVSADGLGLANVGAGDGGNTFPDSNTANFFHKGDMTVEEGAILTFTTRVMFDGTIFVAGNLNTTRDIIILGNFYFAPSASFSSLDDLICSGNSNTRIDIPDVTNSWTSDDLYLDHTDAFVCGLGKLEIGISPGPTRIINLNNGADYDQICTNLVILGCDDPNLCDGTGIYNPAAPVLTGTGGSFEYTENNIEVIDAGIGLTFGEPFLTVAFITISSGYIQGQDTLVLPPPYGIVSNFNSTTGVLTLRGYGTVSTWESVLKSVTFEILSDNPDTTPRTVQFEISDGFITSNTISRNITIKAVNDPPDVSTITGTPTPLAYTEGVGAIAVDTQIEVDDPDDTHMESATISISNYVAGEDFLDFSDALGVSKVGFNTTTGVLTLTGSALLVNYASALSSVTYENTSDTPDLTPRTVTFVVNDGDADSPGFGRVINITATNDVPVATDLAVSTDEDVPLDIDLSALVTDVDDALDLTTINITGPTNGSITNINTTTGVVTYTPTLNYNGGDSFTYTINDVAGGTSNSGTITITVNPTNDVPTITGTSTALTYNEGDGQVVVDNSIVINDTDGNSISSATVTILSNYTPGEDQLHFSNQLGITGNFSNGLLSLNGSASIANYITALSSVAYENTSSAPNTATRTIEFIVNDGIDNSLGFNRDILIIPIAEPTVITTGAGGNTLIIDYTEGDGAVAINAGLSINDPDDVNLEGATINFTNNYVEGEDILVFADQSGIIGSFDTSTGTMTLSGTASLLTYESAILSITYENTSNNPSTQSRTLEERVLDGDAMSNAIIITINILPVNDPPEITGQIAELQYPESSGPLQIDNLIEVSDVDNDNIISAIVRISTNYTGSEDVLEFNDQNGITGSFDVNSGSIILSGTATKEDYQAALRSITYANISDQAFLGDREVEFTVNDGEVNSDPFIRIIVLEEVVDPVIVYQVVTPDNDSMNDTWVIDGIEQYPNNSVRIFNRWNSLVYKKTSYENDMAPWAGETNEGLSGGEAKDGTYFYTVDLGDGSALIEGFLVLKRK